MSDTRQRRPRVFDGAAAAARGPRARTLAAELRLLASEMEAEAGAGDALVARGDDLAAFAEALRTARHQFAEAIGDGCLIDPALDILLGALTAGETGHGDSDPLAATPIAVQRWAALLTRRGLLAAEVPPRLTSAGRAAVCRYVATLSGCAME